MCVRERESLCAHGRDTQEDRSTVNFGCVRVQTLATCAAGECFIHCAMPLGQSSEKYDNLAKVETQIGRMFSSLHEAIYSEIVLGYF